MSLYKICGVKKIAKKTSDYINKEAENSETVSVTVDSNNGKSIVTLARKTKLNSCLNMEIKT